MLTLLLAGVDRARPAGAQEGPVVSLGDVSGLERDDQFGSVMLPVFLSAPASEPVVVSYYTVNDTAIYIPPEDRVQDELFGDYQRRGTPDIPRTVTIPAGATQTSINVSINKDDEVEPEESFEIVISSVAGAAATIGRSTGTATILDADGLSQANPVVTVTNVGVIEGDTDQRRAQFFIQLSRPTQSPLTVAYSTVDGTASAPDDYIAKLPGATVFGPGQISKTIDVLVNSNTTTGSGSSFSLEIEVTGGAPVEELQTTGVASIIDDDQAGPIEITPDVATGGVHTCALNSSGEVRCWGNNGLGQLGDGTQTSSLTPVSVIGLGEPVAQIATGNAHTCALTVGGGVLCWGDNLNGQLGDGTSTLRSTPVAVTGLSSGVTAIGAGDNHTCATLTGGGIKCWGWGTQGQLGQGAFASSSLPLDVTGVPAGVTATHIEAGYQHTCATFSTGSLMCWGRNSSGQLGLGVLTPTRSSAAVQPIGLDAGVSLGSAGGSHVCAIGIDGTRCFGYNGMGQLGIGSTALNMPTPTLVAGSEQFVEVAAGAGFTCSRSSNGAIHCWGLNQEGQLGIGQPTLNNATTPQALPTLQTGQIAVDTGSQHGCAMAADESVSCWGLNSDGQLGNGGTAKQYSPVPVVNLWVGAE